MKKLFFVMTLFGFSLISFAQTNQTSDSTQAISYLSTLSSQIVHRPLNPTELNLLRNNGSGAFRQIVTAWFSETAFIDSAQYFVENLLRTSGSNSNANFNLPGNLGRDIARRQRPYSDLVTANTCVNASGQNISCDSGASYTAGVLTTKAYLITNAGPYNIGRAGKLVDKFLCTSYPLPDTEEPKISEAELISQFATTAGTITFGNGNNCYSCHSQFGHHAQLFVKFDLSGNYRANATGVQNPSATDGFSVNNTMTSHYRNATRAGSESAQFLGRPAANLAEAARTLSQSSRFLPCAVKNLMVHYLRLPPESVASVKPDLYQQIAASASDLRRDPSFSHLLTAIITNPHVYESFKQSGVLP